MAETTRYRKRRTFTITDESYELLGARAADAGTNRSRFVEELIEAQVFMRLDDSDLTLLQGAAEGENLDLPAWMRKTALEAMEPAPPGQVFMQLDDSDLTLLREVAEADNLDLSAWGQKSGAGRRGPAYGRVVDCRGVVGSAVLVAVVAAVHTSWGLKGGGYGTRSYAGQEMSAGQRAA